MQIENLVDKDLLRYLWCPKCKGNLERNFKCNSIESLVCENPKCKHRYVVESNIVDFVRDYRNVTMTDLSYGRQWADYLEGKTEEKETVYGVHADDWREYFFRAMQICPSELDSKSLLDAGCGSGKVARNLQGLGAKIISFDIHTGLCALAQSHKGCNESRFFRADVFHLPFRNGCFDLVWSSGMIHRTPEPERAFANLARMVKEGGRLFIWTSRRRSNPYRSVRRALPFMRKLPNSVAVFCAKFIALPFWLLATAWYYLGFVRTSERIGGYYQVRNRYRSYGEVVLNLQDIVLPEHLFEFTVEEVVSMFKRHGFVDIYINDEIDVGVSGTMAKSQ